MHWLEWRFHVQYVEGALYFVKIMPVIHYTRPNYVSNTQVLYCSETVDICVWQQLAGVYKRRLMACRLIEHGFTSAPTQYRLYGRQKMACRVIYLEYMTLMAWLAIQQCNHVVVDVVNETMTSWLPVTKTSHSHSSIRWCHVTPCLTVWPFSMHHHDRKKTSTAVTVTVSVSE